MLQSEALRRYCIGELGISADMRLAGLTTTRPHDGLANHWIGISPYDE